MRSFNSLAAALVLSGALVGSAFAGETGDNVLIAMEMNGSAAASPSSDTDMAVIKIGSLELSRTWTRAMLPGATAGGGFVTIVNKGGEPDRLVSASSPAAPKVEIHSMVMVGDVMKMHHLPDGLEIPAGGTVELKPGSFHIMFLNVEKPFKEGTTVPVTLNFEKAGSVKIDLVVAGPGARHMP